LGEPRKLVGLRKLVGRHKPVEAATNVKVLIVETRTVELDNGYCVVVVVVAVVLDNSLDVGTAEAVAADTVVVVVVVVEVVGFAVELVVANIADDQSDLEEAAMVEEVVAEGEENHLHPILKNLVQTGPINRQNRSK
jgi:hypothetical protein